MDRVLLAFDFLSKQFHSLHGEEMEQINLPKIRIKLWRAAIVCTLVLIGLSVATAWNLTRSDAIAQARLSYTRGDLASSLQHALDHLRRQPWNREAALVAARCLSRLDFADEAETYYPRAGKLDLSDAQIRAFGLARGPHPERSIPAFNEILTQWPNNVTALRRLAGVELAQNNTEDLLRLAHRLSQIASGAVIGHTLRGVVYHNEKNPQLAVAAFDRVLELDPELREMILPRPLFWSHLTDDLIACGRIDEAGRHLAKVVVNTPDSTLLSRLGRIYFLQGELVEAKRCYQQAAEMNPSDFAPHLELAKLAVQSQNRDQALMHLDQARALAPRYYSVLYSLASVYRQLDRTDDADRVQETIKQLRDQPASSSRPANYSWPRYAL